MAEVQPVVAGMRPDIGHSRRWPEVLNQAAIRRLPAVRL